MASSNKEVNNINDYNLNALDGEIKEYLPIFKQTKGKEIPKQVQSKFLKERNIVVNLQLKVGARVMATINKKDSKVNGKYVHNGFINGKLGVVVALEEDSIHVR